LILVPLGVLLARHMIPVAVMAECRLKAGEILAQCKPVNKLAAVGIVLLWLALAAIGAFWVVRLVRGQRCARGWPILERLVQPEVG
jgi:hypothetical protein